MQSYHNNEHYLNSASVAKRPAPPARRRGFADMKQFDDSPEPPPRKVLASTAAAERRANSIANSPCIEIYPGFEQPLRLSVETEAAIRIGFIRSSECCVCTMEINCIQDARFVLCPVCRTITPLDTNNEELSDHRSIRSDDTECSFGVGLGFVGGEFLNRKPAPLACPASAYSSSSSLEEVDGEEALELFQ
jgi:hypothetical protein